MLLGIGLIYLLLCLRLRIRLEAEFADGQGSAVLSAGAFGVSLRRKYVLALEGKRLVFCAVPRRGRAKMHRRKDPVSESVGRFMKAYTIRALRSGRFQHLMIHARLGLGDACATALAAGAAHALCCSLLAALCDLRRCDLRMTPDFDRPCLRVQASGIFFCSTGDIILAVLRAVFNKRREGVKWTSIPLRA